MSGVTKKNHVSGSEYSVVYSNMRGVDFSGDGSDISRARFAYAENMFRDYEGDGAGILESIPGYRRLIDLQETLYGIHSYKDPSRGDIIAVHAGNKIHAFPASSIKGTITPTVTEGVAERKSASFRAGGRLYVLDGEDVTVISEGYSGKISETEGIYIPTTYKNGFELEQRNLLTDLFYEKTLIGSADSAAYGTITLKYLITDNEKKECQVIGTTNADANKIYIPSRKRIGDEYYSVTSVAKDAFKNLQSLSTVYFAPGVYEIGSFAFAGCTALKKVILSDTVGIIGAAAFSDCTALSTFHIGRGMTTFGASCFSMCSALNSVTYPKTRAEFDKIENTGELGSRTVACETSNTELAVFIEIHTPLSSIEEVTLDGGEIDYTRITGSDGTNGIRIHLEDKTLIENRTVAIKGKLSYNKGDYSGIHSGFIGSAYKSGTRFQDAIKKCTVAESFDGRVFLTGNPDYPGYVFYSALDETGENNPLYFGDLNYFLDGVGNFNNIAMLATGDSLAVFKEADSGDGSIFYHTPHNTGDDIIPKIYPVSYIHTGICALGAAIAFFDDPIFITKRGVSALTKKALNLERSIATRSTKINPKLLCEDLGKARLAVWCGYLAVACHGRIYLADSRSAYEGELGDIEYEWYFLNGIGSFSGDARRYRYSSVAHPGLIVHEKPDTPAVGTVKSGTTSGGETYYYVSDGGKLYDVYPTEEYTGGSFSPLTEILAVGDLLIFGTEGGTVSVFNNDMRGIAPGYIKDSSDFDEEEYASSFGRRIHPYFYTFEAHAPRYAVKTAKDNCGIPHMTKNTVKHSAAIKVRSLAGGSLTVEAGVDGDGYSEVCSFPSKELFFSDMDFSSLTLSTEDVYTVPIGEKCKKWVEKQFTVYSDEFRAPFGIYSIAYKFTLKGKIKKGK